MIADLPALAAECAPQVHPTTMAKVMTTESGRNPFAIGVVGGRLTRQPRSLVEAQQVVKMLEAEGMNYSMGVAQVNKANLGKYGLTTETVFDACRNVNAGASILSECYGRALKRWTDEQEALRRALSCYYSGNFTTGLTPDFPGQQSYVLKVATATVAPPRASTAPQSAPVADAASAAARPGGASSAVVPEIKLVREQKTPSKGGNTQPQKAADKPQQTQSGTDSTPAETRPRAAWDVFGDFSK